MNVALMSGVAVDALIAASIVISLLKSRTGFKKFVVHLRSNRSTDVLCIIYRTDGIVTTLTLYAVSTCESPGLVRCIYISNSGDFRSSHLVRASAVRLSQIQRSNIPHAACGDSLPVLL